MNTHEDPDSSFLDMLHDTVKVEEPIRPTALELEDALDDVLAGFRFWKKTKVGTGAWDTHDEMLARWIEGGDSIVQDKL